MNSHEDNISPRFALAALNVSKTLSKLSNPRNETLIAFGRGGHANAMRVINPSVPKWLKHNVHE